MHEMQVEHNRIWIWKRIYYYFFYEGLLFQS